MSDDPSALQRFLSELRRRRVYRVAVVYAIVAFVIWQAAEISFPAFGFPNWTLAFVIVLTFLGFPLALVLAWAFEITPEGVKRTEPLAEGEIGPEPGNRAITTTAIIVVAVLAVAAAWLAIRDGGPTSSTDRRSIAVLPFVNLSADPEDELFSDGVAVEIISRLSKIADLEVKSRTSSFQYKNSNMSLREIGEALGASAIVEGDLRRVEGQWRISARLIDVETDDRLWADQYEGEWTDYFAIQSDVAQQVATALRATLTENEREQIEAAPTESQAAYDLYLRGRYFWNRRSKDGFYRAIEHFEGAIAEDPGYAQAYAGLADTYNLLAVYWMLPPDEAVPLARAAAERALELDPNLAEAHTCLAHIHTWYDWDWPAAKTRFERALSLDPNYATARQWYGMYLMAQGRPDEGLAEARRAVELDPLSVFLRNHLARFLFIQRRYTEAIDALKAAAEMDPNIGNPHGWLVRVYTLLGRHDEAIEALKLSRRGSGASPAELDSIDRVYARSGWQGVFELEIERLTEEYRAELETGEILGTEELGADEGKPILIARLYAMLGRTDQAFEWLDIALQERRIGVMSLPVHPIWDDLRSDPRYSAALRRMGLNY
ncbi:MAG: tetratricopeptide repeat protein [Gemmatimonadetes bacterium]|nr:tetratricopeptide repeat protein [Gemmatimonadota bacterium]NIO32811.1 tetratricopeptide repeat protein [Gemmatimonadota bacterium]